MASTALGLLSTILDSQASLTVLAGHVDDLVDRANAVQAAATEIAKGLTELQATLVSVRSAAPVDVAIKTAVTDLAAAEAAAVTPPGP